MYNPFALFFIYFFSARCHPQEKNLLISIKERKKAFLDDFAESQNLRRFRPSTAMAWKSMPSLNNKPSVTKSVCFDFTIFFRLRNIFLVLLFSRIFLRSLCHQSDQIILRKEKIFKSISLSSKSSNNISRQPITPNLPWTR